MYQIFGNFIEDLPLENDTLELTFTSSSRSLKKGWRNNRLSAYFIADYFSNILLINEDNPHRENRIQSSKNSVSYISNELLENAVKFSVETQNYQIKLGIHCLGHTDDIIAIIFTKNTINKQKVAKFADFIQELLSGDLNELYVQQVEKAAADEDNQTSGLGLLTIVNDYAASLGWKFDYGLDNSEDVIVTTMAQIIV